MKVKVISRSTEEFTRERSQDLQRVFRNLDPGLRTQEKAVEYARALKAAKMEKIFAKPFIGAMDGHIDAVSCMTKNPNHLRGIFSGSMDGDIRLWDIASSVRLWNVPVSEVTESGDSSGNSSKALAVYAWKHAFCAVDHRWDGNLFATAGAQVDIWDHNRSEPVSSFEWGKDTVVTVRFNPGEPNVLATSARVKLVSKPVSSPGSAKLTDARNARMWCPH